MSGPVAWALLCLAFWAGAAALTWLGSPKFRALYPQYRDGPAWAVVGYSTLFLLQPANSLSKALLGGRFGAESMVVYVVPGVTLLVVFFLLQGMIPSTRRAIIAFDQHLMRKPVTGRLRPEREVG